MKLKALPCRSWASLANALACTALLQASLAGAAPARETALQLSTAITVPVVGAADSERVLLRVEYKTAVSRVEEADVIADIVVRVRRMEGMVADVRRLVDAWPAAGAIPNTAAMPLPGQAPVVKPGAAALLTGTATVDISPTELYGLIAVTAALTFLAWLMKERHGYLKARRLRAANMAAPAAPLTPPAPPAQAAPARGAAPAKPAAAPSAPKSVASSAPIMAGVAAEPNADDAVKLADIMLSMGLTHGAAQTLAERVHEHPRQALFHWFKLMEIYRRSEMREDFEQAAEELRRYFNVQAQAWNAGGGAISFEDYPHLSEQLQALWPGEESAAFLAHLLEDNRGGTRAGFPQSVAEEILLLQRLLTAEEYALAQV